LPQSIRLIRPFWTSARGAISSIPRHPPPIWLDTTAGWLALAGGVLSTGLLGGLLMLGTGYTYRVHVKEEELETVLDQTPFMLARCGRDLRYRFISESYAAMFGRHPEDVVGKPIAEIVGDEAFKRMPPYVEQVLKGNRVEFDRRHRQSLFRPNPAASSSRFRGAALVRPWCGLASQPGVEHLAERLSRMNRSRRFHACRHACRLACRHACHHAVPI